DRDPPSLRPLRLGHAHDQHALVERRVDLLGVDLLGQRHPIVEATRPSRPPPDDPCALLLLQLTGDRQLVTDQLDVDVLSPDARQLGLEHVRVVLLFDIDRRRPAGGLLQQRRPTAEAAECLLEHPTHPLGYLLELLERLPPLRRAWAPTLRK